MEREQLPGPQNQPDRLETHEPELGESGQRFVADGPLPAVQASYRGAAGTSPSAAAYGASDAQAAARKKLMEQVNTLSVRAVPWEQIDALQAEVEAAYAGAKPAALPHYLMAIRYIGAIRNGMGDPDATWNANYAGFRSERDAALAFISPRERNALDHAAREIKHTHDFLNSENGEVTRLDGHAQREREERNDFEERAKRDLEKAKPVANLVHQKNGWMVSGGFYGAATDQIVKGVAQIEAGLAMGPGDARDRKLQQGMQNVETGLMNLPAGVDPEQFLRQVRDDNMNALAQAADIIGALPLGPFSKTLSIALKTTGYGIQYMSGEMSGAEFWTRTLTNALTSIVGGKFAEGGSFFMQGIKHGIQAAAADFAGDCVRIWESDATPEEKAAQLDRTFKAAAVKIFVEGVAHILSQLKGVASDELKEKVLEAAFEFARTVGIVRDVDPEIDKLRALIPNRK